MSDGDGRVENFFNTNERKKLFNTRKFAIIVRIRYITEFMAIVKIRENSRIH